MTKCFHEKKNATLRLEENKWYIMQHGYTKELSHMSSEWYVKIEDREVEKSVSGSHYGKQQRSISDMFNCYQRGLGNFTEQHLSHNWENYKHSFTTRNKIKESYGLWGCFKLESKALI